MYPRAGETDPSLAYPPVPKNQQNTLSHNDTTHPRIQQNPHLQIYPRVQGHFKVTTFFIFQCNSTSPRE